MQFTSLFGEKITFFGVIFIIISTIDAVHYKGTVDTRFSYDDEDNTIGINHWKDIDELCQGRHQSPINIDTRSAHRGHFLRSLQLHNLNASISEIEVENSGTTAEFNLRFRGEKPEITDGPLNSTYVFESFHYHWGILDQEGSEHTVNNRQYSMEGHYLFFNKKYRSQANAGQYSDGFVVISLLYEVHSRSTKQIPWDMIENVIHDGEKHTIRNPRFTLANLIPDNFIYAHYRGSFTTPPCTENIDWIVALDIQRIHPNQIRTFRTLVAEKQYPIADNFRPLQAINGRRIQIGSKLREGSEEVDHDEYQPPTYTSSHNRPTYTNNGDFAFPNSRNPDTRIPSYYG